jgi:membrane protein DedA with SNARE-associated domain
LGPGGIDQAELHGVVLEKSKSIQPCRTEFIPLFRLEIPETNEFRSTFCEVDFGGIEAGCLASFGGDFWVGGKSWYLPIVPFPLQILGDNDRTRFWKRHGRIGVPQLRVLLLGLLATGVATAADATDDASGSLVVASLITFGLLLAAGVGFPIPEELPIIGAGIWAGHNQDLGPFRWLIWPVCIVGVVVSDSLLYGIGRFFGPRLLEKKWVVRFLAPEKRQRIEENFHKYGVVTLLFARFMPAIRSPIFVTAGVMRLSFAKFAIADGVYAIPGVGLLFFLSYWFGDKFKDLVEKAEARVDRIKPLLILLVIAAVAGLLIYHFFRRPMATGDPEELPLIGEKLAAKIEGPHPHHTEESTGVVAPSSDGAGESHPADIERKDPTT